MADLLLGIRQNWKTSAIGAIIAGLTAIQMAGPGLTGSQTFRQFLIAAGFFLAHDARPKPPASPEK